MRGRTMVKPMREKGNTRSLIWFFPPHLHCIEWICIERDSTATSLIVFTPKPLPIRGCVEIVNPLRPGNNSNIRGI